MPDPCPSCGAALAADQRYCLACGQRRADARLPFLEILREAPASTSGVAVAGDRVIGPSEARARTNLAVVAGVGCLLLAMGVGVLIGRSGADDSVRQAAAPAQVIRLQGAGAGADAAGTAAASGKTTKTRKRKRSKSGAASSAAASKASNPKLKQLEKLSTSEYQKQSTKLPKTLGTGGKPPPKDNKKAAGGGGFQAIG